MQSEQSLSQDLGSYTAEENAAIVQGLAGAEAAASQTATRKRKAQPKQEPQLATAIQQQQLQVQAQHMPAVAKRKPRTKWTDSETNDLLRGCNTYGVGNWKKILLDPQFHFNNRSAVDLKDRFRTFFPDEYRRIYPNATTHGGRRQTAPLPNALPKVNRKERRSFTSDEDARLLEGFLKHGPSWSKIQKDEQLNLFERRSTDLRDRFRNAFPEKYAAAGFKTRQKSTTAANRQTRTAPVDPVANDGGVSELVDNLLMGEHNTSWPTDEDGNAELFGPGNELALAEANAVSNGEQFYDASNSLSQLDAKIPIDPKVTEASARRN